jgi:predicted transcriptional regulator of viral defense system
MKLIDAYQKIKALNVTVFQTRDIAAYFNIDISHASKLLVRLALSSLVIRLARGRWGLPEYIDTLQLPELLTTPYPSYISLQTALYYHGMISQVPNVIYSVSLAKTQRIHTPLATISIHHIQPDFFCGYHTNDKDIKIATPEKAIIDFLYLSPTKTRLFASLPELEWPDKFDIKVANKYIDLIPSQRRKTLVTTLFSQLRRIKN